MPIDRLPARIGLAGDAHGNAPYIRRAVGALAAAGIQISIFLGDFGVVWSGSPQEEKDLDRIQAFLESADSKVLVVEGNHEGYSALNRRYPRDDGGYRTVRPSITYLPRYWNASSPSGNVIAALAGANSIDFESRRLPDPKGKHGTFWLEEQIADTDVDQVTGRIDVLLGHEAFDSAALREALGPTRHLWSEEALAYSAASLVQFNRAIRRANPAPRLTVGGHYHLFVDTTEIVTNDAGVASTIRSVILNLEGERSSLAILDTDSLEMMFIDG